jgi:hypothetical protein
MQETHDFVVYPKRQFVICLIQEARLTSNVRRTDRDRHCLALSELTAALNLRRYTGSYLTTRACFGDRTASVSRATSCQSQHVQNRMSSSARCCVAISRDQSLTQIAMNQTSAIVLNSCLNPCRNAVLAIRGDKRGSGILMLGSKKMPVLRVIRV